jgi:SpoU rRNA methylase family enzyme
MMDAAEIERFFTRSDGSYLFARWGRPIAPIVFGVQDTTLSVVKGAFEAVCQMAGHQMAETDPELGTNVMVFFFREWEELLAVPDLDRLIDGLVPLVAKLSEAEANQYRVFRFDAAGAIKACFVFLRMDDVLTAIPAETLALSQVVQSMLLWSDVAFTDQSPLGQLEDGRVVLRPDIGALIRAAYDPVMPAMADDASHALRLAARMQLAQGN